MSYGAPITLSRFSGLDLRRKQTRNDGSALVEKNMDFEQINTIRKRRGFIRSVDQIFPAAVSAIIPTRHCYFIEQFIYGTGIPGQGVPIQLVPGNPPIGCRTPKAVTNLSFLQDLNNFEITISWTLPNDNCVSGIRIVRKEEEDPVGPNDPNSVLIYNGVVINQFLDDTTLPNVDYHYGVFTFSDR